MNKLTKILFLCFAILALQLASFAHPVDLQTAQSIASKFMETNDLQLVATYPTDKNITAFYVFNTTDGFVIVAADDCETPIIAYSHEGRFDPNNVPAQMAEYLNDFAARIQYGIKNHIEADDLTARQWELVKTTGRLFEQKSTISVAPLLTSTWHQGCLYNSLCPAMTGPCEHAEAGCVAVAMGQIMHYWRYPSSGWGSYSYYHMGNVNAHLSADFANTTYDWDHMPDSLTESSSEAEIEAVATLLFHCGVSVEMTYSTGGSSSNSNRIPNALIRYFNYSKHIHWESRDDYSDEEWLAMIKSDLEQQRPVQYSGSGSGGHAFICDGYDSNNLLHFNWGWGGSGDGYFALGNLNPIGYQFNSSNSAIFSIVPQYEPWLVNAIVYPPSSGTIIGNGEYHIGESCTLTAVPAEQCEFYCWKRNGQVLTFNPTYTIEEVDGDIDDLVANFTLSLPEHITASLFPDADNPNSPSVNLSWELQDSDQWTLLKEFNVAGDGVGTDGEYVYTSASCSVTNDSVRFRQYTMDGDLVEAFSIEGCNYSPALAFDGSYFYYLGLNNKLHCVDLANRTLVSIHSLSNASSHTNYRTLCVYDPLNDGFWIPSRTTNLVRHLTLISRNGQSIREGPGLYPLLPLQVAPWGSCYHTAKDETRHLLFAYSGKLYDYNITNDILCDHSIADFQHDFKGACIGQYEGKEALFLVYLLKVHIFEIKCPLSQIAGYRIYRTDSENNTVMLAEDITGTSYIDNTWNEASVGVYRFGISSVFSNGVESEILWSNTIVKTTDDLHENHAPQEEYTEPSVQKVIENGQIVIIKDGKRYTMTGQQLN